MTGRLVVVGFDAGPAPLVRRLAHEGRLPTIAGMLERGTSADVDTPYGTLVGAVWPDFVSASNAARHGRYCYEQLIPGSYDVRRTGTAATMTNPFWLAAADRGRDIAVVDVPHTDVQPHPHVTQVVDWGRHDPNVGFRTSPSELGERILREYGRLPEDACDQYCADGRGTALRDELLAAIPTKTDFLCSLLAERPWDLFLAVYSETHCAGHQFWSLHDPEFPVRRDDWDALGDPLVDVLVAHDRALGRIAEAAGPDATVVALYSHGMAAHYDATFLLDAMLERIEHGPARPSRSEVARRKLSRAWQRRRAAAAKRRGAPDRYIRSVDGRRRWFQIPNNDSFGAIRLNVVGREPRGKVQPGADFDETCRVLDGRLRSWVNTETGEPIVANVVRTTEHLPESDVCALPDLFVEWNRSARIRSIEAPGCGRIDREFTGSRSGDHRPGGLVAAVGPRADAGDDIDPVRTIDLGPTFCGALGVELADTDGVARGDLLGPLAT